MLKRITFGVVLSIVLIAVAVAFSSVSSRSNGQIWDQRYAVARAADDCEAMVPLVVGGALASHLPAVGALADLKEAGSCGYEIADVEYLEATRWLIADAEGWPSPPWIENDVLFEGLVRIRQGVALATARDVIDVGWRTRIQRDCGPQLYGSIYWPDRILLRELTARDELTLDWVLHAIRRRGEVCWAEAVRINARTETLKQSGWEEGLCSALLWMSGAFQDMDAAYRVATECDDHLVSSRGEGAPDYYHEENLGLRYAAARGHVLAARDYAQRTLQITDEREAASGPLPARLDPTWFVYLYARRAMEAGEADAALVDWAARRLSQECLVSAQAFYGYLSRAWAHEGVDWPGANRLIIEARDCSYYGSYKKVEFAEILADWNSVPEFSLATELIPMSGGGPLAMMLPSGAISDRPVSR